MHYKPTDATAELLIHEVPKSPDRAADAGELADTVDQVLSKVTPREEKILRMRYGIGHPRNYSLEEVGEIFDVTKERIRQIEIKTLRKMRGARRTKKVLAPFLK